MKETMYYPGHSEQHKDSELSESPKVSKIIYGCMNLAGTWEKGRLRDMAPDKRQQRIQLSIAMLESCLHHGINFFDHADIYGRGKSEEVFAAALKELKIQREQLFLQSKCGIVLPDTPRDTPYYDFSKSHIIRQVEGSLQRLETDYLDVLLLHRPDALMEPEEIAEAFTQLQEQGKVRAFGVSNFSATQTTLLQAFLPFPLVYNQMQISLYHHELISSGLEYNTPNPVKPYFDLLDYCRLNTIRLQAWSPLASGKMFQNPDSQNPKQSREPTRLQKELQAMAQEKNSSPESLAIAWLLQHPAGIQPIIGTTKPARLEQSLQSIALTKAEWYQLLVAAREKNLP